MPGSPPPPPPGTSLLTPRVAMSALCPPEASVRMQICCLAGVPVNPLLHATRAADSLSSGAPVRLLELSTEWALRAQLSGGWTYLGLSRSHSSGHTWRQGVCNVDPGAEHTEDLLSNPQDEHETHPSGLSD